MIYLFNIVWRLELTVKTEVTLLSLLYEEVIDIHNYLLYKPFIEEK